MLGTRELLEFGQSIPPIPILRGLPSERNPDCYIVALRESKKSGLINPFELFIARKWVESLAQMELRLNERVVRPSKADRTLISCFEQRKAALQRYIGRQEEGKAEEHPLPRMYTLSKV